MDTPRDKDGAEPQQEDEAFDPSETVAVPIGPELDLHTFRPADVALVVEAYIEEAQAAGLRRVRLVHGKGRGHLRRTVHKSLERHPLVESFSQAGELEGSWGATIAFIAAADSKNE